MKTAKRIKKLNTYNGIANLYKLSETLPYKDNFYSAGNNTEYIVVSTILSINGLETVVFPSKGNGIILDFSGIKTCKTINHDIVVSNLDYKVISNPIQQKEYKFGNFKKTVVSRDNPALGNLISFTNEALFFVSFFNCIEFEKFSLQAPQIHHIPENSYFLVIDDIMFEINYKVYFLKLLYKNKLLNVLFSKNNFTFNFIKVIN